MTGLSAPTIVLVHGGFVDGAVSYLPDFDIAV
jgi:hypothetical protein